MNLVNKDLLFASNLIIGSLICGCTRYYDPTHNLKNLAQIGDADAQFILADGSIPQLEVAAKNGNAQAAFKLGTIYSTGDGAAKDLAKSVYFYELAGQNGDSSGFFNAALAYEHGDGVTKSLKKAFGLFQKAAAMCDPEAIVAVAQAYYHGKGVQKNLSKAYHLLLTAMPLYGTKYNPSIGYEPSNPFPYASMMNLKMKEIPQAESKRIDNMPPAYNCN
jgi:hypothetical protein